MHTHIYKASEIVKRIWGSGWCFSSFDQCFSFSALTLLETGLAFGL